IVVSVVEGSGSAVISDNVIDGVTNGAIIGQRWADPVTGDLAKSNDTGYAHLTVERNHVS
ncbi:TIGR03808 family TAT-translocated repetitive protein, partial [bacterium M00.F.Ca.ET.159.01.1.1]